MRDILFVTLALVVLGAVALAGLYVHSRQELAALEGQTTYSTPEEAMHEMAALWYAGLKTVEIVHGGYEPCFLENLYFIEARVWADSRTGGKAVSVEGDNPGGFFLKRGDGWVWLPEGRRPWFVALGARWFGDG
jgi:hypothetical protein